MRLRPSAALALSAFLGIASAFADETIVALEPAFPEMKFSLPVAISPLPGSKDVVFIIEKGDPAPGNSADKKKKGGDFLGGKVQMISGLTTSSPIKREVFQLSPKDGKFDAQGESGFLGFAVHPKYAENKQVFVYYSLRIDGKLHQRISRFLLSSVQPFTVDPQSEQALISQLDPAGNHNGGDLHFGPDGYLYISCGDGGGGGDPFDSGGFINKDFHAAVFRIDVDKKAGNPAPNPHPSVITDSKGVAFYAIPADNPFLKATSHRGRSLEAGSVRTETWATGLRNAWRFSFDPSTGRIFAGDVGQNRYEEIDIIVPGGDYGWNTREGFHTFDKSTKRIYSEKNKPDAQSGYIDPIYEYEHKEGISVTGGCVYRGEAIPSLKGAYIFADYGRGWLKALREVDGVWTDEFLYNDVTVTGFGFDPRNGDILYTSLGLGEVRRLTVPKKNK
jgi:glucose/arabinose dehydrogenase